MLRRVDAALMFAIVITLGISFLAVFLGALLNSARLGDVTARIVSSTELLRAEIKASTMEIRTEIAELKGEIRREIKESRSDTTLGKQVMDSRLERLEAVLERHHSELVVRISDIENARRS